VLRRPVESARQRAPVVLQQIVELRSGGADAYLALLAEASEPINASCGFSLLGSYATAFRHGTEVMLLWAFPDIRTLARLERQPEQFPAYASWREMSRSHELSHRGDIMRPTEWSPLR
jgi:hypothetical protein